MHPLTNVLALEYHRGSEGEPLGLYRDCSHVHPRQGWQLGRRLIQTSAALCGKQPALHCHQGKKGRSKSSKIFFAKSTERERVVRERREAWTEITWKRVVSQAMSPNDNF